MHRSSFPPTHHDIHHDQARNVREISGTSIAKTGRTRCQGTHPNPPTPYFYAQSCKTSLSLQIFLFLTPPKNIWIPNKQEKYPVLPNPPPPIANYEGSVDASDRTTTKAEWGLSKKNFYKCINMNAALVTRFLSLINLTFKYVTKNHN